ncbi:hypothetical protein SAMN05216388_1008171 [Halorientalis persicus]|jgi:hypothetical protein|uniref:Uncharacterized protein n=1 Tax=Halorientalis persicus TaxID=1367881 RepID=A0A1H8M9U8_9EURY|nr:hypothetical protein [Halorientalis persicus]SEO14182.1 hypothetical protein SAMN05216388_1008171 [Halorientalis persicus]
MGRITALEYYDEVLAGIALSLLGGGIAGLLSPVAVTTGIFAGSLLATGILYLALFRNPPTPASDPEVAAAAVVWHVVPIGLGGSLLL